MPVGPPPLGGLSGPGGKAEEGLLTVEPPSASRPGPRRQTSTCHHIQDISAVPEPPPPPPSPDAGGETRSVKENRFSVGDTLHIASKMVHSATRGRRASVYPHLLGPPLTGACQRRVALHDYRTLMAFALVGAGPARTEPSTARPPAPPRPGIHRTPGGTPCRRGCTREGTLSTHDAVPCAMSSSCDHEMSSALASTGE